MQLPLHATRVVLHLRYLRFVEQPVTLRAQVVQLICPCLQGDAVAVDGVRCVTEAWCSQSCTAVEWAGCGVAVRVAGLARPVVR
jgi:hypothetical protein